MKKILVIEDDAEISELISEILTFESFDVFQAPNGIVGLILADDILPNLILCDIMMPVVDGFEVLQQIRKNDKLSTARFIFVSALADKQNLIKAQEMGCDNYLLKPFTTEELLSAVLDCFASIPSIISDIAD